MTTSLLEAIQNRGVVRVPVHWDDTSAQYLDPGSGEPAGMVGLVGYLLAEDLGVQVEFVEMAWADQIPALLDGSVDISIKHTNTPQRAFEVEFTLQSILCEDGRIVIRHDSDLRQESDLNQPERSIAAGDGASQIVHIRRRYPLAEIRVVPTATMALELVATGAADASLHDTLVPGSLAAQPHCTVLTDKDGQPIIPYRDCIHPAIKPGDQRMLNWLNSWMAFHKATGTFETLIAEAERAYCIVFAQD